MSKEPIPPECIGLPDEETMSCSDGLVENHHYMDMRRMNEDDLAAVRRDEQAVLAWSEETGLPPISDEAYDHFVLLPEGNLLFDWIMVDAGVASTVVALSVIGCCPVTSCSGGDDHYESHPLVVFWAESEQLELVKSAVKAPVELCGASSPGLMVYTTTGTVQDMAAFSVRLEAAWRESGAPVTEWPPPGSAEE